MNKPLQANLSRTPLLSTRLHSKLGVAALLSPLRPVVWGICLVLLSCIVPLLNQAYAQVPDSTQRTPAPPDTVISTPQDTVIGAPPALSEIDSTAGPFPSTSSGTQVSQSSSGMKQPVQFSATDSLVIVFDKENGDRGTLSGNAKVTYGESKLDAHTVDILFDINELRAKGLPVDTGMVGRPHFEQGGEAFTGSELAFNLRSERGRVVGARTSLDEGFISGSVVKVDQDSTIYVLNGAYTTCECVDDPSYTLRASKMKIVDQKWVYTGPIQLYLFNIPMPLWLPFGFLPAQEGRRSGPLPPNYGEDERGFFLRDWGWYWAVNEYMDLQLRMGIWTRGSWQIAPLYRYNRRYRYSGQLQIDYVKNRRGERGDPDYTVINTSSLRWTHNQTLSPHSNFTSNVNLSTSNYLRTISENYADRVRQTIESSVRFDKTWAGEGRRLSLNLSQRQILATGETSMTIPGLTFSQSSRKPFARENRIGAERWYERITYNYSGRVDNRFDYRSLPDTTLLARGDTAAANASWWDALVSPGLYRRATGEEIPFNFRSEHNIPVSAYFTVNRIPVINKTLRLNVTTGLNYSENWYLNTVRRDVDSLGVVRTSSIPGFFAMRQFSTSLSANTTFYGLFPFRIWKFNGFRHTVRPTASLSYSPDYSSDFWGYTRTYLDRTGREVEYAIAPDRGVIGGRQQVLSLSISNVLESKFVREDSLGDRQNRPLKLLDFDMTTGYNFAADSLRLSDLSFNARTSISNNLHLTFRAGFSPYRVNTAGTGIVDQYLFSPLNFKFVRLTRMDFTARTSFRSFGATPGRPVSTNRARMDPSTMMMPGDNPLYGDPLSSSYNNNSPLGYTDFNIPWSLNLDFSYNIAKPYGTVARRSAVVNAAFDFNLTPNWKVQGRTGFDLVQAELVTTDISIYRDFDCWEMSFNWVPFGAYQSYGFDLHVKSGKLRDLLRIRQPRSDIKDRFGRLVQ